MKLVHTLEKTFFLSLFLFFLLLLFITNIVLAWDEQQFSYLAESFLAGKLFFIQKSMIWGDTVFYNRNYFWPLGPFPAIILLPLIWTTGFFNIFFSQGYLNILLVVGVGYFLYRIAQRSGFSKADSLYWVFAFCCGSAFLGVALVPWSWYFAQVVATLLLFIAIHEYVHKKRYWLIGLCMMFLLLTRVSAALGVVFFIGSILMQSSQKMKKVFVLLSPFVLAVIIIAWYNYARFGNIVDQGYSRQLLLDSLLMARKYGVFTIIHIPGNLYYFFLSTPLPVFKDGISHVLKFPFVQANPWGMSVFITSPCLVWLFFQKYRNLESKIAWFTVGIVSIMVFSYYGIGYRQFGYRYSLDFLPWLYFLLIRNWRGKKILLPAFKRVVMLSAIGNLYLFVALLVSN